MTTKKDRALLALERLRGRFFCALVDNYRENRQTARNALDDQAREWGPNAAHAASANVARRWRPRRFLVMAAAMLIPAGVWLLTAPLSTWQLPLSLGTAITLNLAYSALYVSALIDDLGRLRVGNVVGQVYADGNLARRHILTVPARRISVLLKHRAEIEHSLVEDGHDPARAMMGSESSTGPHFLTRFEVGVLRQVDRMVAREDGPAQEAFAVMVHEFDGDVEQLMTVSRLL